MDELVTTDKPAPQAAEMRPYGAAELKAAVLAKLTYAVGKAPEVASRRDWFLAVTFATRDIAVGRWLESLNAVYGDGRKRVYYLSLEFLIGRLLFDAMTNLGIAQPMAEALDQLGVNLSDLRRIEPDAALGNGGLGRLAACFMDSMATLSIAAHGYGIRYDNGLFRQIIRGGWQQEAPEDWLSHGNPWEFERAGEVVRIEPTGPLLVSMGTATDLAVDAAIAGVGVICLFDDWLRPHFDSGALEPVLEPWWQRFSGPFLYYSGRRLVPAPLRAFIDFVRASAQPVAPRNPRRKRSQ